MAFQLGSDRPFAQLEGVGIAIKHMYADQNHMGIVYRVDAEAPRFCHLAFHFDLRDEEPRNDYFWDDCHFLRGDPLNSKLFSAKMLRVAEAKKIISYGFHYEGAPFASDGVFIGFPEGGMGVTCATFVVAVFHSFGYPIIVADTWESRADDVEWQNRMLTVLQDASAPSEHVEAARQFAGVARFRPEEVAVAATHESPPVAYAEAVALANELNALIRAPVIVPDAQPDRSPGA